MAAAGAQPAILLMGPTAAGKTDLAIALHEALPVELISVDSAMIYRDMDIGTAKPDTETLARAPHHLVDIIEPEDSYSVAQFLADARQLSEQIWQRGRVPLFVGGTMLYFRALQQGLSPVPAGDSLIRERLQQQWQGDQGEAARARLAEVDPAIAARLEPADRQRILRALEVFEATGVALSDWQLRPREGALAARFIKFSIEPERAVMHERVNARFEAMLEGGFIDEVRGLRARPGLTRDHASMRAVGYRQAWDYLAGDCDAQDMRARGQAATRQLLKRQMTWLRKEQDCHRLAQPPSQIAPIADHIRAFIDEAGG